MSHKFDFNFSAYTRDDISQMSIEEIQRQIFKFRRMIREAKSMGRDTMSFEVEFCYLDQERQARLRLDKLIRNNRRNEDK